MNLIRLTHPAFTTGLANACGTLDQSASLDNPLERFFSTPFGSLYGGNSSEQTPLDIHEDDKAVTLRVELPGARREDITLEATRDKLTVQATRKLGFGERTRELSFSRSFQLSDKIQSDTISATYENGVLSIVLPKKQSEQPRKIAVS